MARGIIAVKSPTGTGAGSTGKLIVSNGKISNGSGLTVGQGATIEYIDQNVSSSKVGDIVDFTVTDVLINGIRTRAASAIVASPGITNLSFVYDPTAPTDYTVNVNESLYAAVQGPWSGNFTVKGGSLVVATDADYTPSPGTYTAMTGVISAATDTSYVVIANAIDLQSDLKVNTDSDVAIRNSQISGSANVVASKKSHVIVRNCSVLGGINAVG